jgi:UDP-glucose 4-epimerase
VRVAILGATGNVGTSVLEALRWETDVDEIVAIARRPGGELPGSKIDWRQADITETPLEPLFDGVDAVVHLIGRIEPADDPDALRAVNVDGVRRAAVAARAAGVSAFLFASTTAAYAQATKETLVDESYPLGGVSGSPYARQKAEAEQLLDEYDDDLRIVRLRFDAVFKREAGTQARGTFLGRVPTALVRPELVPVVPDLPELRFQAVHADDLAEAFRLALHAEAARGAYNVAADPVLDAHALARLFAARVVPAVPGAVSALRAALAAAHAAGVSPLSASWLDFVTAMPLIDSTRIRTELGWEPQIAADQALLELVEGIRTGAREHTAALGDG